MATSDATTDGRSAPTARNGFSWPAMLLWLALPLLLIGVGWVVLEACGVALPTGGRPLLSFCPEPETRDPRLTVLGDEQGRERVLQDEWERLRLAMMAAPDCPVPQVQAPALVPPATVAEAPPVLEPAPPPPPPPEMPLPQHRPAPPPVPPVPESLAELPQPPPPPLPDEIPEEAFEERDVSYLQGCWSLDSDYRLREINSGRITGVRDWQMCFDANGRGTQNLTFDNGVQCGGSVGARFEDGESLAVNDLDEVSCSDGTRIFRREIDCQRTREGSVDCTSIQPTRPNSGAEVSFSR